jgi:integrase
MSKKKDRDGVYTRKDRSGIWLSYKDANGRRKQIKTAALTIADAKKIRAAKVARVEKMKVLGVAEADAISFNSVAERYLTYQKPRISQQSYDRTESIIRNHLTPFFDCNIGEIRSAHIERFVTSRMATASSGTVIKELNILKHIFRLAVRWELIPTDPAAAVERPPTPPDRVRYLYPDELVAILGCCPEWLRPIVILAVATGMRRGEILGLRWRDIDLVNKHAMLGRTKNGDARIVTLNKIAITLLNQIRPANAAIGKLFPNVRPDYVTGAFKRATERAKIEDFHFHDLRHTYASWVKMAGEDVHTVAVLLGHKDLRMAMRYQHLNATYLSNAAAKLENVFPALLGAQSDPGVTD